MQKLGGETEPRCFGNRASAREHGRGVVSGAVGGFEQRLECFKLGFLKVSHGLLGGEMTQSGGGRVQGPGAATARVAEDGTCGTLGLGQWRWGKWLDSGEI